MSAGGRRASRLRVTLTTSSSQIGLKSTSAFEVAQLVQRGVVDARIAGDDGDRRMAVRGLRPQTIEKAEAVHERHPQIEEDRIRRRVFRFLQADER